MSKEKKHTSPAPLMTTKYEGEDGMETHWKCPVGHWRKQSSVRLGVWHRGPSVLIYPECPDCRADIASIAKTTPAR